MKKTLIALAALTVTGAFAQSAVTIYGRAHVGYDAMYQATGGKTNAGAVNDVRDRKRVTDDGSRVGLRITEDLGGGLRAFSVIETGVNLDSTNGGKPVDPTNSVSAGQSGAFNSGTGNFGSREAHVGVGNAMGELRLGRQNVFWGMGPTEDVSANRISGGVGSSYSAPSSGYTSAPAARLENTVQVVAGAGAGGFAGSAIWFAHPNAAETTAANTDARAKAQGFTLRYIQGPFGVQYDNGKHSNTNNGVDTTLYAMSTTTGAIAAGAPILNATINGAKLGLSYSYAAGSKVYFANSVFSTEFSNATENAKNPVSVVGTASSTNYTTGYRKQASNQFGIQHRMGNIELHGQYVNQGNVKNVAGASMAASGSTAYAIGVRYELSNRTAITSSYNIIDNDANNNITASGGGQSATSNIGLGATLKVARVSIQHNF